jgi:hypothetical protein
LGNGIWLVVVDTGAGGWRNFVVFEFRGEVGRGIDQAVALRSKALVFHWLGAAEASAGLTKASASQAAIAKAF